MSDTMARKQAGGAVVIDAPPQSERTEQQRARILDAAERCFIDSGFHAASMADIAGTARMSPGLIYRYFKNKSALIRAIIDRHLQSDGCRLSDTTQAPEEMARLMLEAFEHWCRQDHPCMNAALYIELTAECTRDAQLARTVRSADQVMQGRLSQAIQRGARTRGRGLAAAEARGRAVILQCLCEGLAMRAIRDPQLSRASLKSDLDKVLRVLMS